MATSSDVFRPSRTDWLDAGLVAALVFVLYAASAPRTVALEDDGLFILSSYFLGIEHPPGYPLFTLLGHLFSRIPLGSVAYRVHLASALFGAFSVALAFLCARALGCRRVVAFAVAVGFGISPVFWSQAIIAEVYTLNTFFFLLLLLLGLRACPPLASEGRPPGGAVLACMAFLFGLSLSNHYPLMLLVAPAFAILLWPKRAELLARFGNLLWLVVLGLLPYAWLVYRSWQPLPISFYGPLDTLKEIWFFISRAGYGEIDQSATANWLDRIRFFEYQAGELVVQFALVGTLLAGIGFMVQWRMLGRRIAASLTVAFVMSTLVLLTLLNFDYDSMHKHVYHVYPLPAYAVAALWMGLGLSWLGERYALSTRKTGAVVAVLLVAIASVGVRENFFEDHAWGARMAQTVLALVPKDAIVFGQGDPDLVPMAYFHLIEGLRPDITLYHPKGLVLGNRLYHAERTDPLTASRLVRDMVEKETRPVVSTLSAYAGGAQRDHWLYSEVDKSSSDPKRVIVDIPDVARRFFEESVARTDTSNAWVAFVQSEMRRRYAVLVGRSLPRGKPLDERTQRDLQLLHGDFYGALGLAEGLMLNPDGYFTGAVAAQLEAARSLMPSDINKEFVARFFYIRGALRANAGDRPGAIADLEEAIAVWRLRSNPAIDPLEKLLREGGNAAALQALQERVKSFKAPRS